MNEDFCKRTTVFNWKDQQKALNSLGKILGLTAFIIFCGGINMGLNIFCKTTKHVKRKLNDYRKQNLNPGNKKKQYHKSSELDIKNMIVHTD